MSRTASPYSLAILFALGHKRKHVYEGTVSNKEKSRRRALNKMQRVSRKANRP